MEIIEGGTVGRSATVGLFAEQEHSGDRHITDCKRHNMHPSFQYYEEVRIKNSPRYPQLVGKVGVVLGMAQDEQGHWSYAVAISTTHETWRTWSMLETQLQSTGKMMNHSDFYDGTKITVIVNEFGEGKLK